MKHSDVTLPVAFMIAVAVTMAIVTGNLAWLLLIAGAALRLAVLWWQIRRSRRYHPERG